jgi:hypothetical protein
VALNKFIVPVCLPPASADPDQYVDQSAVIVGWGTAVTDGNRQIRHLIINCRPIDFDAKCIIYLFNSRPFYNTRSKHRTEPRHSYRFIQRRLQVGPEIWQICYAIKYLYYLCHQFHMSGESSLSTIDLALIPTWC